MTDSVIEDYQTKSLADQNAHEVLMAQLSKTILDMQTLMSNTSKVLKTVTEHNASDTAHPSLLVSLQDLTDRVSALEARVTQLEQGSTDPSGS